MKTTHSVLFGVALCCLATDAATAEPITLTIRESGRVSLAVYDADGVLRRSLLAGKPMAAGEQRIEWDGKDDNGNAVPRGPYQYRGLVANIAGELDGIVANTAQRWGGYTEAMDYTGVVCGSDGSFYLLSCGGEFGERIQKYGADGKLLWDPPRSSLGSFPWLFGVDTDGKYVYLQRLNGQQISVVRLDARTGKPVPYGDPSQRPPAAVIYKFENFRPPNPYGASAIPQQPGDLDVQGRLPARGLAEHDGLLYLPVASENRIIVASAKTGKVHREIADVAAPRGITDAPDGSLLVSTAGSVVRIDPRSGKRTTVVRGLSDPHGLDIDADGNIFVADRGDSQQVKKFSPNGKLLLTIGHKGGRLRGRVDPHWLCAPSDVAVDLDGNIYITEQYISRLQKFDPDGKFLSQWYSHYAESPCVDPRDPRWVYVSGLGQVRAYKADLKRRSHEWTHSWIRAGWHVSELMPGFMTGFSGIRYLNGGRFLFNSMPPDLYVMRFVDGKDGAAERRRDLVMAGQVGIRFHNLPGDDPWNHSGNHPAGRQVPGVWTDANGDGIAQKSEVSLYSPDTAPAKGSDSQRGKRPDSVPAGSNKRGGAGDLFVDDAGNIYLCGNRHLLRLPLQGFNKLGNPLYDYAQIEVVWTSPDDEQPESFVVDRDGNIWLTTTDFDTQFDKHNLPGRGTWPRRHRSYSLRKLLPDGQQIWRVGSKATGQRQPGQFYFPSCVAGVLDDLVYVLDVDGTFLMYDKDGLYVGQFGAVDGENWWGCVFKSGGKTYAYANSHAWHLVRRFRVTGTDRIHRIHGTVSLSQ